VNLKSLLLQSLIELAAQFENARLIGFTGEFFGDGTPRAS
jgi:hypothetical protein